MELRNALGALLGRQDVDQRYVDLERLEEQRAEIELWGHLCGGAVGCDGGERRHDLGQRVDVAPEFALDGALQWAAIVGVEDVFGQCRRAVVDHRRGSGLEAVLG